jgi:hypothetical protein
VFCVNALKDARSDFLSATAKTNRQTPDTQDDRYNVR